jgi:hypothetical protein
VRRKLSYVVFRLKEIEKLTSIWRKGLEKTPDGMELLYFPDSYKKNPKHN